MADFKLWLEFEEVDPSNWDKENDFANIHVDLSDGRHYGINVWTYKFLETTVKHNLQEINNLERLYIIPPDLIVKELTGPCIHQTITDLLKDTNTFKLRSRISLAALTLSHIELQLFTELPITICFNSFRFKKV